MLQKRPNYKAHEEKCVEFLRGFEAKGSRKGRKKYMTMLQEVSNRERLSVNIDLDDFNKFDKSKEILKNIEQNTLRYVDIISNAIDICMPPKDDNVNIDADPIDVFQDWRLRSEEENKDPNALEDIKNVIPKELKRRYSVSFKPRKSQKKLNVRNISSDEIGHLITVKGIVTRVTDVKPMMKVAVYVCDVCGNEVYQKVNKRRYKPIYECPSNICQMNRNKRALVPQIRGSKFVKFQEITLQESPEEVPEGNVPRSITVYAMGEFTRQCQCGDKVTMDGIWLPIPKLGGFGAMYAGLTSNTYLYCMNIIQQKKGYKMEDQDPKLLQKVNKLSKDQNIYSKLAKSIAPEIYGLEDVKKALLLTLIAGVTKEHESDGMRIRGDINCLLMGDPGVAKSQLLKHIGHIAPRCVYTTGKGSSGVGLTAAVLRDPLTKDMVLEGGALVLADMGICCIDEFDKMEESDRTAIHEVMEQQTISIAKAGITTTLNARTAIIAAANPAFGRYDKKRSPEININIPAALLSRFDLLFVLVDESDYDKDLGLARHITHVHQHSQHPKLDFEPFNSDLLRAYITKAKTYNPLIPKNLSNHIAGCYVEMRKSSLDENGNYNSKKIVGTPRTLLSILRLGQSLARLRFSSKVSQSDIEEAMRLMREAKHSMLESDEIEMEMKDTMSKIYDIIRNHSKSIQSDELNISQIKTMLTTRGFQNDLIDETLKKYQELDIWVISTDKETLSILN